MRIIRDYALECCWLLVVLAIAAVPASAVQVGEDWDDQAVRCQPCQQDDISLCYCFSE